MKNLDLSLVPFSIAGSWLRISALWANEPGRLVIGCIAGRARETGGINIFEISLLRGKGDVPFTYTATPTLLELHAEGGGGARFTFQDAETFRFEAHGVDVQLSACHGFGTSVTDRTGRVVLGDTHTYLYHHIRPEPGTSITRRSLHKEKRGPVFVLRGENGPSGAIRCSFVEDAWPEPLPSVDEAAAAIEAEWNDWMARMPDVPERYREDAELAWHINWLSTVSPRGRMTRRGMLMSKNWMTHVWSWDNCFNAQAVCEADLELAWDQMLLMFDLQDEAGCLPDGVSDHMAGRTFVKPPVYGWTIMRIIDRVGIEPCMPYLREVYEPLGRVTDWWYRVRDYDGDGMCQYHHGNDSGWDNATAFDQGFPTEGSDLAAHLVLQTEALALIADALGRDAEAAAWRGRSEKQLADLLEQGVDERNRFFSPLSGCDSARETRSLLNYIPMVLGSRLPGQVRAALVEDLQPGRGYLTDYGLATQAVETDEFDENGYWRGAVWPPSTYLIFDGLCDAGETELARTIAERYCEMCLGQGGMYENYSAVTGRGLCDPAYTWGSSVFLLLAQWLHEQG